jgi:hypothetical protein
MNVAALFADKMSGIDVDEKSLMDELFRNSE